MTPHELATRLLVQGEIQRDQESKYAALSQSTNDSTLLELITQAENHCRQSAEWTEKAARLALALARFRDNQQNSEIEKQRDSVLCMLDASIRKLGVQR